MIINVILLIVSISNVDTSSGLKVACLKVSGLNQSDQFYFKHFFVYVQFGSIKGNICTYQQYRISDMDVYIFAFLL